MSQFPPDNAYDTFPASGGYPPAEDNSANLVRLAVIFNYIAVGLDFLGCLAGIGMGMLVIVAGPEIIKQQQQKDLTPESAQQAAVFYIVAGIIMAVFGVARLIATRKLQKNASWGWGLALGIIGCCQICPSCICLETAAGIYTVVIMCFKNVQAHLRTRSQEQRGMGGMGDMGGMGGPGTFGN